MSASISWYRKGGEGAQVLLDEGLQEGKACCYSGSEGLALLRSKSQTVLVCRIWPLIPAIDHGETVGS
jgi:hypothetical protein